MIIKQKAGDFRVREILEGSYLRERGDHRVYRITKRKLTTHEALRVLAREAGIELADVSVAGLKDRQAIAIQHASTPRGREVRVVERDLRIEPVGFADEPLSGAASLGNAFELTVRSLRGDDIRCLRRNLPLVREHGLVAYFDEQRFGNLTHGQGWIAKELARGEPEAALKMLLATPGTFDDDKHRRFKTELARHWGQWKECRDVAGRFGAHHSVFEHLGREPDDFIGAFTHIATRVRLIHLYAFQSHLWNRAVAELVRSCVPYERRIVLESEEGPLVGFDGPPPAELVRMGSFPLPGEELKDVVDARQRTLLEAELAREGLRAEQFKIRGVAGFQLKGEDRPLLVVPRHLRVRPAEEDPENRGLRLVRVRFDLPRGTYASLVVRRLFARPLGESVPGEPERPDRAKPGSVREEPPWKVHRSHERRGRFDAPGRDERRRREES